MIRNRITAICMLLLLSGCSLPDWIGGDTKEKLTGERVTLLNLESPLEPDVGLKDMAIRLPYPEINKYWYKSSGYDVSLPSNPQAPWEIRNIEKVSIGKEGSKYYYLTATPVVAANKIFTMDGQGLVTALDAGDIREKAWKTQLRFPEGEANIASGGMTYHKGKLFITTGHITVVALNAADGHEIWRRSLNSIARSAPAVKDGKVFVSTLGNHLYALDMETGGILWSHAGIEEEVGVFGNAAPVAKDDVVIIPYSSGEIYALNVATGNPVWSDSLTLGNTTAAYSLADIDASPVVAYGNVYAMSNSGILAAMELDTGIRVWEQDIAGTEAPWPAGEFLFVLGSNGQVAALHAASGRVKWVQRLPVYEDEEKRKDRITWNGPVLAGSRLLLVGSHGKLVSLSPLDGKILNTVNVPEGIYAPPVVAYSTIYLFSNKADVIELRGLVKKVTQEDFVSSTPQENKEEVEEKTEAPVKETSPVEIQQNTHPSMDEDNLDVTLEEVESGKKEQKPEKKGGMFNWMKNIF